jgi:hypothetical protein
MDAQANNTEKEKTDQTASTARKHDGIKENPNPDTE